MKNKSSLFSGIFVFRNPEGPAEPVKRTEGPATERETHLFDQGSLERDSSLESYAGWKVDQATEEAGQRGQELTKAQIDEVRSAAKLELQKYNDQARMLSEGFFDGAPIFPCDETQKIEDFLYTQGALPGALSIESGAPVKDLYPGLENQVIEKGQFLVVLNGGKKVEVVDLSALPEGQAPTEDKDVIHLAAGERNEEVYAGVRRVQDRFMIADGGKVQFKSKKAEKVTTLGEMFKEDALVVDGKLAVKGADSQYHRVVEKRGGKAILERRRVYVKTGTEIDTNISQNAAYLALVKKVRGETTDV